MYEDDIVYKDKKLHFYDAEKYRENKIGAYNRELEKFRKKELIQEENIKRNEANMLAYNTALENFAKMRKSGDINFYGKGNLGDRLQEKAPNFKALKEILYTVKDKKQPEKLDENEIKEEIVQLLSELDKDEKSAENLGNIVLNAKIETTVYGRKYMTIKLPGNIDYKYYFTKENSCKNPIFITNIGFR